MREIICMYPCRGKSERDSSCPDFYRINGEVCKVVRCRFISISGVFDIVDHKASDDQLF